VKHTRNDPSLLLPVIALTECHSVAEYSSDIANKWLKFDVVVDIAGVECLDEVCTVKLDHRNVKARCDYQVILLAVVLESVVRVPVFALIHYQLIKRTEAVELEREELDSVTCLFELSAIVLHGLLGKVNTSVVEVAEICGNDEQSDK
jgi:hypothetical protein